MRRGLKYTVISLLGGVVLLLLWGMGIEPRFIDEVEAVAYIPGLPAAWEGQRVALIADLQVGMWLGNTDTVRRIVRRLVARPPALVLIAGDFIYHPIGEQTTEEAREEVEPDDYAEALALIRRAVGLVQPLPDAGMPTYAVFGNHDYGIGWPGEVRQTWVARALEHALTAARVHVLDNTAVPLRPPEPPDRPSASGSQGLPLYLVGIGSHLARHDKPLRALAQVPAEAPRLVVMHHPESFAVFPAGTAPLALAAHTHGGQVRLPWTPEWSWMTYMKGEKVHADGWIHGYGQPGNHLYVNRGIGFSRLPIRINCSPEVTFFTLRRQS
ncbi:MAG: metallophosphoesterase [Candidatus Tectimicrobiota bacterium]